MRNQTSVAPKSKDVVDTTAELSSAPGIKKARLCSGIDRCPSEAITRSFDFALQIYGEKLKPPNIFPKKLTSLLQLFQSCEFWNKLYVFYPIIHHLSRLCVVVEHNQSTSAALHCFRFVYLAALHINCLGQELRSYEREVGRVAHRRIAE